MRTHCPTASLDTLGFEIHRLETAMEYGDFHDDEKIENTYCRELEKYFVEALSAKYVRALDYQVRRKSPEFPYFGGKLPPRPQPSLMTHVDVTPEAAKTIVSELYGDIAPSILQSRYQVITVWKPLRPPVRDWPLAVCDATSVNKKDLIPTDIIYPAYIAENCMVHYNVKQKWYWIPDQKSDELLVFKAVDSKEPRSWPCPHGAFPLPGQTEKSPSRESIDVRLLVMYADIEYPASTSWAKY